MEANSIHFYKDDCLNGKTNSNISFLSSNDYISTIEEEIVEFDIDGPIVHI